MRNTSKAGLATLIAIILGLIGVWWAGGNVKEFVNTSALFGEDNSAETIPNTWYDIYFTDPACAPEANRTDGLDAIIADDLLSATSHVDLAGFEIGAEPIVNALIDLERRGVPVRIVTDSDYGDNDAVRRLRRNGLSVIEDERSGFMHNKFIVIDDEVVWTGSMNFTSSGAYCNNNNMVRFVSADLAANYVAEMNEMAEDRRFGPRSPNVTPNPAVVIGNTVIENYFAPEGKVAPIVADELRSAESEILFMTFSFTQNDIGGALLESAERGVPVRGVFETLGADNVASFYPYLAQADELDIDVRLDGNPNLMHHKVILIDGETTIFGSYNFTDSADTGNDENLLIVHDPDFTSYFIEEFETIWEESDTGR